MLERSVTHATFNIERTYPTTPERVFAAFADPAKKRRWFAEGEGHTVEEFEMDFRLGGSDHARFRFKDGTPLKGQAITSETTYLDIVPNRRIVFSYTMAFGEKRFSATLATLELLPAGKGTQLLFTHQGAFFEGADGPQMRQDGWGKLFDRLAQELAR